MWFYIFLQCLEGIAVIAQAAAIVLVIALVIAGIGYFFETPYEEVQRKYAGRHVKHMIRAEKERIAHQDDFEESCVPVFSTSGAVLHRPYVVASPAARQDLREMDRLADEKIFENTKDL